MNKIENLRDLLIEEGRELYDAGKQELAELPSIEQQVSSAELRKIIKKQSEVAKNQQQKIKDAFNNLNIDCEGSKCETTQTILRRSQQIINQSQDRYVRDAGIIGSMQKLNHRKIAGYGAAASYAREIGHEDVARTFHDALQEEKKIDKELSELAQKEINKHASHHIAV